MQTHRLAPHSRRRALTAIASLSALLLACPGGSQPAVTSLQAGELRFQGGACPQGATPRELNEDFLPEGSTAAYSEFEFPGFLVVGGPDPAPARAECVVTRPIAIPAGVQIRLLGGEWGGVAQLVGAGTAGSERQYQLDGDPPRGRDTSFDPEFSGSFFLRDDLRDTMEDRENESWTACSDEPAQRTARARILVHAQGEDTQVTLSFGRVFTLEERPCP